MMLYTMRSSQQDGFVQTKEDSSMPSNYRDPTLVYAMQRYCKYCKKEGAKLLTN